MKKRLIVLVLAILALLMIVPLLDSAVDSVRDAASQAQPDPTPSPSPSPTPEPGPTVSTVRFSATGDNLIHTGIYNQAARRAQAEGKEGYDFSFCYDAVRDFYAGFDVNWINQETLVNDELEPSSYPGFSTPGDMGRELYDTGFRVFSLANNHTYDKGAEGIAATRRFWSSLPEDAVTCGLYAGEEDYDNIVIRETNGIRIAYLSYTEFTNGIPTPSGAEANLIYTSQTDGVVIGTHPHVVQDAQWLTAADGRQVFVAYSLGNFLNAQSTADTMIGAVLSFTLEKTTQPDGSSETVLKDPMLHPTVNHYGQNYSQIRIYLYKDYTDELAQSHGVRENFPDFSRSYIESVLRNNIDNQFLDL